MKLQIVFVITASFLFSGHCGETTSLCMAGKRKILVEGRFTGPLVCSRKDATFVLVGRTAGGKFMVYDYRYRYFPSGGAVMHGGQRLVILQGNRYVGQYALSPPPYIDVSVKGNHIILETSGTKESASLDFTKEPPKEVWVNGEAELFFR